MSLTVSIQKQEASFRSEVGSSVRVNWRGISYLEFRYYFTYSLDIFFLSASNKMDHVLFYSQRDFLLVFLSSLLLFILYSGEVS